MRAHLVVIDAPGLDDAPCLDERAEHVLVEALVAQLAVEALHEAVLHRLARRDVVPVDPALCRPAQHGVRGQLRPVLAPDPRGLPPDRPQALEHTHDPLAWQRRVDLYAQAPPRELVLDVEHTKAATALQRVRHEVEHPDRIGASRFLERRSRANRTLTSAAATHFQALLTIEPPDLLQVPDDAAPPRHLTNAADPEATSLGSELLQKSPLGIVTPTLLLVTHRGSIHRQKPRGAALRHAVMLNHVPDRRVVYPSRQKFFPPRSSKAALSSICSARSFFSRRFSSSSAFSFLASDTSMPPTFPFHSERAPA